MRIVPALVLATTLLTGTATADEGNGVGNAFITATPATLGGTLTITWGDPTAPFAPTALAVSNAVGPVVYPGLGTLCLDVYSSGFGLFGSGVLDVTGQSSLSVSLPSIPGLTTLAPVYAMAVVANGGNVEITKTIRIEFENPDAYKPSGVMSQSRALHTSTSMQTDPLSNRCKVLIAGGGNGTILAPIASKTVDIYSPLTRTFSPATDMMFDRALHRATLLANGKVLVVGGADTIGNVQTSCEIYDPDTDTWSLTGSMSMPRAGHALSVLPSGQILVTGGLSNFVGGSTMLAAILNTADDTGEVYDPTTGVWLTVPGTMASGRFGHNHTTLADGRVLISGGINGGFTFFGQDVPTYTSSCNIYDPVLGAFTAAASMGTARAGQGASLLGNNEVLVTGGIVAGLLSIPTASSSCERYDPTANNWTSTASLPTPAGMHQQVSLDNGEAIVIGGLTGTFLAISSTSAVTQHDGFASTSRAQIGTNPGLPGAPDARGTYALSRLYDGTFLLSGGSNGAVALPSTYVFNP